MRAQDEMLSGGPPRSHHVSTAQTPYQQERPAQPPSMLGSPRSFMSARTHEERPAKFLLWHLWVPLGIFAGLILVFELTDLDLRLSDLFFDFQKGLFPWKNAWWAKSLIHSGGKILVGGIWISFFLVWFSSFLKAGDTKIRNYRAAVGFLMLSMISGPATVACMKPLVNKPYPEHIKRYGGPLEYTKLFQGPPPTNRHYKGFPAGHASGGYGLMGLYFVFRERRPKLAPLGLAFGLLLGSLFGFGQQVRGMHYASHNIWSASICWFEALALYLCLFRGRLAGEVLRPSEAHIPRTPP